MKLPYFTKKNRIEMSLVAWMLFSLLYLGAGIITQNHLTYDPSISIDQYFILLPWSILIYCSQYIFAIVGVWAAPNDIVATKCFYGYMLATLLATLIFVTIPTQLPRVDLETEPFNFTWQILYQWLYVVDVPTNCFPSLHTSLAMLSANSLMRHTNNLIRIGAFLWATAIIISTLTTKQHAVLDVLAGMVLFYVTISIINLFKWQRK